MMKNTINSPIRKLKLLLIMPLMAVVFYAFAAPEYKYLQSEDLSVTTVQDTKTITGKVVKEDGTPLSGANIVISGKTIGTITDNNGNFKLQLTDDSPIVVSYVGLASQKLTPEFDKEMLITLKTTVKNMEGLVVVGYGKASKGTDPNSPIGVEEVVVVGYGKASKGTENNSPSTPTLQLRNSNGSTASPLYVIDGVIDEDQDVSNIKPENIESISIIKDASAISKYGDKGKNGVVEIILKSNNEASTKNVISFKPGRPFKLASSDDSSHNPLIVIDGVIAENKDMSSINPETIESITVLKGESATITYGDKGKNGVVEIILKKGQPEAGIQEKDGVYTQVEEMPRFPGEDESLRAFLASSIKYPAEAQEKGIQGKVFVSFVVTKTGRVANAKITQGIAPSLDREALRVINLLPPWKPGRQNGKMVDVEFTLPIDFILQGDTKKSEATNDTQNPVFLEVEEMPEFPGGDAALRNFIATHVKYPIEAQQNGIQGKVFVNFVVTKTGTVANAKVVKEGNPSLDKEALRVVGSLPAWTPGKQKGVNVDVQYTIPIIFALQSNTQTQANPSVQKGKLIIVPNPTNKQAKVTLEGSDSSSDLEVSLFDNFGKLLRKENKKGPSFSVSVNSLTPGTYLIVATDGSKQYQGYLIVNR